MARAGGSGPRNRRFSSLADVDGHVRIGLDVDAFATTTTATTTTGGSLVGGLDPGGGMVNRAVLRVSRVNRSQASRSMRKCT